MPLTLSPETATRATVDKPRTPTYREARARLYSLEHWGIKLGLDNIAEFCASLGNPERRFHSIHVAGTNGKGSTSAFLDSILRKAGFKVGRYTSPHLRDFRERIHIDGRPIPAGWVTRFVDSHWQRIIDRRYSYFEVSTAMAFDAFARAKVDIAVVEVGLGGRFDATNIIEPIISVITRIARDHEHILGHTPEEIAFEKAGIIKTGAPVIIGPMIRAAEGRIRQIAGERLCAIWSAHEIMSKRPAFKKLISKTGLRVPLYGDHQLTNLSVALATISALKSFGLEIDDSAVVEGVASTVWPARFQIETGPTIAVYDAAHNPDGIRAVVETWRRQFGQRKCVCVFNTRPEKDYVDMLRALIPILDRWIASPMPDSPSLDPKTCSQLAGSFGIPFEFARAPRNALRSAKRRAGPKGAVLVTGSHYLVGAIIPARLLSHSAVSNQEAHRVTYSELIAAAQDRGAEF